MNRRGSAEVARLEEMLAKREAKVEDAKRKLQAARERSGARTEKT